MRGIPLYFYVFVLFEGFCFSPLLAQNPKQYDETFDPRGEPHEVVRVFEQSTAAISTQTDPQVKQDLYIKDSQKILPAPWIIETQEAERIRFSVEQRAKALSAFFEDMVMGEQKLIQDGLIDRELVHRIFNEASWNLEWLRNIWKLKTAEDIWFLYGPDLIRAPTGEFVYIEDNIAWVGGLGSMAQSNATAYERWGLTETDTTELQVLELLKHFTQGQPSVAALPTTKPGHRADYLVENFRRYFTKLGIDIIDSQNERHLREAIQKHGQKRVFNYGNGGSAFSKRTRAQQFAHSDTLMIMAPGTSALSNKGLLPYTDLFIEYYLGEKPIFRTARTDVIEIDVDTPFPLPEGFEKSVIKSGSSRKGHEVLAFASSMNPVEDWPVFEEQLFSSIAAAKNADRSAPIWVQQEFIPPSQLPVRIDGEIERFDLNLRIVGLVNGAGASHFIPTPWARAKSANDSDKLVNIDRGAARVTVIPTSCSRSLIQLKI